MAVHYRGSAAEGRALDAYVKLMRAANTVQARLERQLRRSGLSENQFGLLEMLHHLGPLYQHQLGSKLLVSRANITLLVDQLSRKRLVRREQDRVDRRRVRVRLTPEGKRRIARAFPAHLVHIVQALSVLDSGEQVDLAILCRKLGLGNLDQSRD